MNALAPRLTVFELSDALERLGPVVAKSVRRAVLEVSFVDEIR